MEKLKKFNSVMLFGVFLFAYSLLFFYVLFFKNVSPLEVFSTSREYVRSANFIPFFTIGSYLAGSNWIIAATNLLGNIAIFIPLGIYLQLFRKTKRIWLSTLIVLLTPLVVEALQYVFALGAVDIDDVILNILGGFIGILGYRGLYALLKNEEKVRFAIVIIGLIAILVPVLLISFSGMNLRLI